MYVNNIFVYTNIHVQIFSLFHDVFKANIYNHKISESVMFFIQIITMLYFAVESKEKN
jgi:hypothetical protein